MGWVDRLLQVLRREQRDAREAIEELTAAGDAALDRREAELNATPEERLRLEQERISETDAELDEIRRRIAGGGA